MLLNALNEYKAKAKSEQGLNRPIENATGCEFDSHAWK